MEDVDRISTPTRIGEWYTLSTKKLIGNVGEIVEHWSLDEVTVEKDRLGSSIGRGALMVISRTETKTCTLPSVRKTLISVDEVVSDICATYSLISENDCYVAQVLDNGHIDLLGYQQSFANLLKGSNRANK